MRHRSPGLLSARGAETASADATTTTKRVAITGWVQSGERFRGAYRVERVTRAADGSVYAVVDVRGRVAGREVARRDVRVAVVPERPARGAYPTDPWGAPDPHLTLGLPDPNLLGLRVRLSRVDLLIG